MLNKVELGSVNIKNKPQSVVTSAENVSFTGMGRVARDLGNLALKGIQKCEEHPMINVAVLDLSTAILPRTFFETFIGSKQKDENGEEQKRRLNVLGGFEAFRRESSGLLINCIIPSFIVIGAAKLLNRPVMGMFNKSNLTRSWANSDTIQQIEKYYTKAEGVTKEDQIYNALKAMFNDIEGVDGDIDNGGLKQFREIFANDTTYDETLKNLAQNITSDKPDKNAASKLYKYMVEKSGISENIRFNGEKGFFSSNLKHLCESVEEILHGSIQEGLEVKSTNLTKYLSKAKTLVNAKSLAGLGIIIPLAISAQPINRWITHKMAGKKGAPIYNDDEERILNHLEKKKLTAEKFFAVPLMWGVAGLSMLMDRPSLRMFQFKNIFPTMDQARIISAATFSSRIAASEDSNELQENTIRDIATFSSFYFLGDYAAKGIATWLEKFNKDGIKLINRLKSPKEDANVFERFWIWAKHTKMKSTDELKAIKAADGLSEAANIAIRQKARNLRAACQLGNIAFSLLSLGVFIPLYTRTQTNKKKQMELEKNVLKQMQYNETFTHMQNNSPTFKSFFDNNKVR
ncbi:hypothetical protein IJ579_01855 [bacterium]|nr:hypothetical protein [bacterium]